MKSYSTALFVPIVLLVAVGVAIESFTAKTSKVSKQQTSKLLSSLDSMSYDCDYFQSHVFHDSLHNQLDEYHHISEKQGIQAKETEKELKSLVIKNELVEVNSCGFYKLDTFYYSYPFLTPDAKDFLDTVGARFNELIGKTHLKNRKIIVTSLTRTTATVSKLVRVNRNASLRSPHLNGNSFDISFNHFTGSKQIDNCDLLVLQEGLSKILYDLRYEKKCWVTYEHRQRCLHVVARKSTPNLKELLFHKIDFLHLHQ